MFEEKSVEEQVSYLKACLPLNQFNNVVEGHSSYSEETVAELIEEGKRALRLQMQNGRDYWKYLKEDGQADIVSDDDLFQKSYRELAYYAVAMNNSGLETSPVPFEFTPGHEVTQLIEDEEHTEEQLKEKIIENGGDDIEAAFSTVGRNIWDVLGDHPEIRLAHFEDQDHIYLEFWMRAKTDREFHERKGEFIEFPVLRKIDCRVHLDDGLIEIRGRNERERDREQVLEYVEHLFGNTTAITVMEDDLDITDDTIRHFMDLPEFVTIPHASKAGTARSNWTSDSDVRDDSEYPDHRPHNHGNLVFNLDSVGRVSFQLSADNDSFRVFKHNITPQEHQQVVEFIWRNINAADN
ncbi:hypothetical protein [Natronobacterium texcoconense]|uniref:Uncharacterized protein n=1 Tax=Natronobacterium texcoconense TaxID=1095778 RepID=A0A1H1AMH4_NATTX|nr:hypothetical protein [Natronobacterium texcoconense]SDQ40792.1 hypothetical protein SAMN04489842_0742 [Natronobacterium texcoconense]